MCAQDVEHLADMRVEPQPPARYPAVHLGEKQRQLRVLLRWQRARIGGGVLVEDRAPDRDRVELRILLGTGPLLLLEQGEVPVTDLPTAQVDALIGQEVPGRTEDLLHALLGVDVDERAVHVEQDGPHAEEPAGHTRPPQHDRSSVFARCTSLPP